MARPRKPLSTKSDTSHLTKEQQEIKKLEEEMIKTGSEQLQTQPDWLRDEVAKKEWDRLLEQFEQLEIISNLDYNNLGAYCNSFSAYIEISKKMEGQSFVIKHTTTRGAVNLVPNPFIQSQMKYSEEMRKYASMLGLTIDSRLKIAGLKLNKKSDKIEDDFGDI